MTGQRKIGVLMGGLSAERDVSLRSGEAIVAALADRGYDAWPLFVDRDVDLAVERGARGRKPHDDPRRSNRRY